MKTTRNQLETISGNTEQTDDHSVLASVHRDPMANNAPIHVRQDSAPKDSEQDFKTHNPTNKQAIAHDITNKEDTNLGSRAAINPVSKVDIVHATTPTKKAIIPTDHSKTTVLVTITTPRTAISHVNKLAIAHALMPIKRHPISHVSPKHIVHVITITAKKATSSGRTTAVQLINSGRVINPDSKAITVSVPMNSIQTLSIARKNASNTAKVIST